MPDVIDFTGKTLRQEPVPEVFAQADGSKVHALFRAVHRELANRRAGTASTLHRDEVRGGGRKPWRQKGTGRARHGSIRSPQWRHGGVAFGPKPRSYAGDLNKKERRVAFVAALAEKFSAGAVTMVEGPEFPFTKTAELAAFIFGSPKAARTGPATLLVHAQDDVSGALMERVARNIRRVGITHTGALDVKDILRFPRLVFTVQAYEEILRATRTDR